MSHGCALFDGNASHTFVHAAVITNGNDPLEIPCDSVLLDHLRNLLGLFLAGREVVYDFRCHTVYPLYV